MVLVDLSIALTGIILVTTNKLSLLCALPTGTPNTGVEGSGV